MPNLDLIISNGMIVNGTGADPRPGSVAIEGDRIVAVDALPSGATARRIIDARGGLICPGFIDIHTHSDVSVVSHPCCASKIHQGVTTRSSGTAPASPPFRSIRCTDRTIPICCG